MFQSFIDDGAAYPDRSFRRPDVDVDPLAGLEAAGAQDRTQRRFLFIGELDQAYRRGGISNIRKHDEECSARGRGSVIPPTGSTAAQNGVIPTMAEVLIVKTGSVTKASLRDVRKAGIVVVESDTPERCVFMRAGEPIPSDGLLMAAMKALSLRSSSPGYGSAQREAFVDAVLELLKSSNAVDPVAAS